MLLFKRNKALVLENCLEVLVSGACKNLSVIESQTTWISFNVYLLHH